MPDLAYILRHPMQEIQIAARARHAAAVKVRATPPMPKRPSRVRMAIYYSTQRIAREIVAVNYDSGDWYADTDRPDILSEDDRGDLLAPARCEGYWEPFRPWKVRHVRAALKSRRTGLVNFMEFE